MHQVHDTEILLYQISKVGTGPACGRIYETKVRRIRFNNYQSEVKTFTVNYLLLETRQFLIHPRVYHQNKTLDGFNLGLWSSSSCEKQDSDNPPVIVIRTGEKNRSTVIVRKT